MQMEGRVIICSRGNHRDALIDPTKEPTRFSFFLFLIEFPKLLVTKGKNDNCKSSKNTAHKSESDDAYE